MIQLNITEEERAHCNKILEEIKGLELAHEKRMEDLHVAHRLCSQYPETISSIVNEGQDERRERYGGEGAGARNCAGIYAKTNDDHIRRLMGACQIQKKRNRGRPRRKQLSVFEKMHIKLAYSIMLSDKNRRVKSAKIRKALAKKNGIGERHMSEVIAETSNRIPGDDRVLPLLEILE